MKVVYLVLAGAMVAASPFRVKEKFNVKPMEVGEKYEGATLTQAIAVVNSRDRIEQVRIKGLAKKWHQSGGMEGIEGWSSEKRRYLPPGKTPRYWVADIQVLNSFGDFQPNRGIKREYPDGTRFEDILRNTDGKMFEHRVREKKEGKWKSFIAEWDESARPLRYHGLRQTCASCHDEAGTGAYGEGLVPGGDTVLSDPLDWSVIGR